MKYFASSLRRLLDRWTRHPAVYRAPNSSTGFERRDPRILASAAITTALFCVALNQQPNIEAASQATVAPPDKTKPRGEAIAALRKGDKIDINSATSEDLQLLPRIGPSLAARIVEDRQDHGSFRTIEELKRIRGIGAQTLEHLRPWVRVATARLENVSHPAGSEPPASPTTARGASQRGLE